MVVPVRDLASAPMGACGPVRRFGWRTRQRHRPGLQFVVSTGRHHGFESMVEQRLLLALDFAGDLVDVVSQPFRLRFDTVTGSRMHIPDFLAVTRDGTIKAWPSTAPGGEAAPANKATTTPSSNAPATTSPTASPHRSTTRRPSGPECLVRVASNRRAVPMLLRWLTKLVTDY